MMSSSHPTFPDTDRYDTLVSLRAIYQRALDSYSDVEASDSVRLLSAYMTLAIAYLRNSANDLFEYPAPF